jgi:hypothetical protein
MGHCWEFDNSLLVNVANLDMRYGLLRWIYCSYAPQAIAADFVTVYAMGHCVVWLCAMDHNAVFCYALWAKA